MRRREFIAGLGSTTVTCPVSAHAQQALPVVGYLDSGVPEVSTQLLAAFRKGLSETGYVDGRNVAIELRWALNNPARRPELAAEMVERRVAVIVTSGAGSAIAARDATKTIPIVFRVANDPVGDGLVASLNRPGGNVTGVTNSGAELAAKRLGLMHALIPSEARLALLVQPNTRFAATTIKDTLAAAASIGRTVEVLTAANNREIDGAFASLAQLHAEAL